MKLKTRKQFDEYISKMGNLNNRSVRTGEGFNYTPAVQQTFEQRQGESVDFLGKINRLPVTSPEGQKIGLGVNRPVAGRTDTEQEERKTRYVGELTGDKYRCEKTDFDTHISYKTLDTWAALDKFQIKYRDKVLEQVARDRLMIGWNGTHAAVTTDFITHPNLEDVNEGWLHKVKTHAPDRIMGVDSDGTANDDTWSVGPNGAYSTLDALVFDVVSNLLDSWHQDAEDLVLIIGRELWVAHGLSILNHSTVPTERTALRTWFADKAIAGLPTIKVPFFPKRGLVVTSYDNLSLYYQEGALRRTIIDNAKRDRIEEYISSNDAYVVEDYGKLGAVRNGAILLPDGEGGWK